MAKENRKYVVINASEVSTVDFSQVLQREASVLRYSVDGSKTFVKFEGGTPSFLDGKTQYTHSEIRAILDGTDWYTKPSVDANGNFI